MPDGPGRFRQDSSCPAVLRCCLAPSRSFGYGALTLFRRTSHSVRLKRFRQLFDSPSTPALKPVWAPPLSLAATQGIILIFLSSGYLDVSVPRVPFPTLWIGVGMTEVCSAGFPHSEISGSKDICSSPKLFAAYHVFHRLLVPRHPPYALSCMTNMT